MFFGTYVCNVVVELAVAHNSIHPILAHHTVLSQVLRVSFA
jgi:heme exporter protein D